jgi:hypothetical protein
MVEAQEPAQALRHTIVPGGELVTQFGHALFGSKSCLLSRDPAAADGEYLTDETVRRITAKIGGE